MAVSDIKRADKAAPVGGRCKAAVIVLMAGVLLAVYFFSFILGRYDVPIGEVFRILFGTALNKLAALFGQGPLIDLTSGGTLDGSMIKAVVNVRFPRITAAALVGCCLSAAGAAYQGVFQNPMASPDILGASNGAAFGAALAILLGGGAVLTSVSAFAFSIATVAAVFLIAQRAPGRKVINLILAGIMIGSFMTAGTSYIKLVADPADQLPKITYWLMGSLNGIKVRQLIVILPMAAGLILLLLVRWRLNLLTLGDDEARTLGVNTSRLRLAIILAATLVTASSVSISGMIGWVGLVVPHFCRRIVGSNYRYLMPAAMLAGASFLIIVDDISRNLLATEIPIGILTAFVGAPFFIYLLFRKDSVTV